MKRIKGTYALETLAKNEKLRQSEVFEKMRKTIKNNESIKIFYIS